MKQRQASIRILHRGIVAPLSKLVPPKDGQPGQFDGGVYDSGLELVSEGLQEKQGYDNVPIELGHEHSVIESTGRHLFAGMLQNSHFGHFMVESTARLWALRVVQQPDTMVFYSRIPGGVVPSYARQLLELVGFEGGITLVDRPTTFSELWVPSQLARSAWVWGYEPNRKLFHKLRDIPPGPHKRVYVSRSRLSDNEGAILFEERIEQELSRAGYVIIHPQELSLREQLSIYNGAQEIIFSEGSSLHLYALMARPDQRVFVIWRRRVNDGFSAQVQSFGGATISGASSVKELWVPASAPSSTANARAVLDFGDLFGQLSALGFIDNWSSAEIPSRDAMEREILKNRERTGKEFEPYRGVI